MGKIEIEITKECGGLFSGGSKTIVVKAEDRKDIDDNLRYVLIILQ